MNNCKHLYILSTIACQLSESLSTDELSILSTDLNVLADMIESILANQESCS